MEHASETIGGGYSGLKKIAFRKKVQIGWDSLSSPVVPKVPESIG